MPLTGPSLGHKRILLVEDAPEDAELMCGQMLDAGLEASFERVESLGLAAKAAPNSLSESAIKRSMSESNRKHSRLLAC